MSFKSFPLEESRVKADRRVKRACRLFSSKVLQGVVKKYVLSAQQLV